MPLLCNYTFEAFAKELAERGEPAFVAKQIMDWVYEKHAAGWDAMTNLSAQKRKLFSENYLYPSLQLLRVLDLKENLHKFQWELHDNKQIEATFNSLGAQRVASIYSQAGASKRYLEAGEMVEQVLSINQWAASRMGLLTDVVYKGEAFKNYDAVLRSVQILIHPKMGKFSQKHITLCTGSIEGIKKLTGDGLKVTLKVALHAPNHQMRKKIVASAKKNPLDDLLAAADEYAHATKGQVIYEYGLVRGVNDHPDHAFELANLIKRKQGIVHIVPYAHPIDKKLLKDFRTVLFGANVKNTIHSF